MYGYSGVDINVSQNTVGDFLVTTLDADPKEDIEKNRRDFLMHFLTFENYMQVDFSYPRFGGLKSFATRMSGDPEQF